MGLKTLLVAAALGSTVSAGAWAETVRKASDIIGAAVLTPGGDEVGTVEDLIVGSGDDVSAAVLSVGGFLGIGDKLVMVPYDEIRFSTNNTVIYPATRDGLEALPSFEGSALDLAAADSAAKDAMEKTGELRGEYEARAEVLLDDWSERVEEAKRDGADAAGDAGRKFLEVWDGVQVQWRELKDASDDAWDGARESMDDGMKRLGAAWDELTADS